MQHFATDCQLHRVLNEIYMYEKPSSLETTDTEPWNNFVVYVKFIF